MESNPVRWFEIYVQDMGRAKSFYESVFQFKLEKLDSRELDIWAFPMLRDKTGTSGALVKMEGFSSGGNSTLVYFGCADCSVEATRGCPVWWADTTREDVYWPVWLHCACL